MNNRSRRTMRFKQWLKDGVNLLRTGNALPISEGQARKGWSTAEHLLESNHPISRLSLLSSKFVVESLVARVGHWPYPPGELQLMTIARLCGNRT